MLLYEILNNKKARTVCYFGGHNFDLFGGWCLLCGAGDEFTKTTIHHCD